MDSDIASVIICFLAVTLLTMRFLFNSAVRGNEIGLELDLFFCCYKKPFVFTLYSLYFMHALLVLYPCVHASLFIFLFLFFFQFTCNFD